MPAVVEKHALGYEHNIKSAQSCFTQDWAFFWYFSLLSFRKSQASFDEMQTGHTFVVFTFVYQFTPHSTSASQSRALNSNFGIAS